MECTKAVSIGKALSSHLASDHNDNPKKNNKKNEFQNCLKKIVDIKNKNMNTKEKQNFYDKNTVYEFNEKVDITGKKILLIDDVVTQGFTAAQCLKELKNAGAKELCFYAAGNTKPYEKL